MSKYGVKIRNYEAGSIYGYNLGVRKAYDFKEAMFTNSLFLDFITKNGLDIRNDSYTRDIICVNFNYGLASAEDEIKKCTKRVTEIENIIEKFESGEIVSHAKYSTLDYAKKSLDYANKLLELATKLDGKYEKISREQLREDAYENGLEIKYANETIHYRRLFRTAGKAKKGSCMFICDRLYDVANDYLTMGISLPKTNTPIVEICAYSSLVTSTIIDKIKILPQEILVLKEVEKPFNRSVVSIEMDNDKHCITNELDSYTLTNALFDGQALIDKSILPDWCNGYLLLRQHFCKMAAFSSNIQLFFKDYYGETYETATVHDMWGNIRKVKDIKLITTENAMKWLKFEGITFDYWVDKLAENDYQFGIVKTAHASKLGNVQRMSYQMINSLDMETMEDVVSPTVEYVESLKKDNNCFLGYLKDNVNYTNDYDVILALVEHNPNFVNSEYFRNRKRSIINSYILNLKTGKLIQNADNLVIVGSPYAMLLHSVGEDVEKDDTFAKEDGTIQCFTERFADGEYLAEFRNPFNSRNNMGYLHNVYSPKMKKYFNFGNQIVAVNMIGTDFQDRNNGSDQDSDTIYTTNSAPIVAHAKYCYAHYPTIVNNIPKDKNHYSDIPSDYAKVDNKLAASQLSIGESSNLAQICLTYTYNFDDNKFYNYVCQLSVLAQAAIDSAKRVFEIDIPTEIARIKKDISIYDTSIKPVEKTADPFKIKKAQYSEHGYPSFWLLERKDFDQAKINYNLVCPMNEINNYLKFTKFKQKEHIVNTSDFLIDELNDKVNRIQSRKVEKMIEDFSLRLYKDYQVKDDADEVYLLLRDDFETLIKTIRQTYISSNYKDLMLWLLKRAFREDVKNKSNSKLYKNKVILLKTLFCVNPDLFLKCFKQ